jgi:AcrR family transcriptional regulator
MGRLINKERQARARHAKEERKRRIRAEAIRSFSKLPYVEVTLDAIGQRAGLKRGIASMYFGTKEELFLQLLRDQLEDWYGELEGHLSVAPSPLDREQVAHLVAATMAERTVLTRLLSLAAVVMEQNMEIMEAYRFQRWQRDRMTAVGAALEGQSGALEAGEGVRLLHLAQLVAGACHPVAHPQGSLAVNLQDPDFAVFRFSMEEQLEEMVQGMLRRP